MKKVSIVVLVIVMVLVLAGCNLFNGNEITKITLPASVMNSSEMSRQSDLEEYALENGFESAAWNEDGSLTVSLTNKRKADLEKEIKESLQLTFKSIMASRDTYYIRSIEPSKDYRIVTITADKEAYENSFELTSYTVGMSVAIYQSYAGEEAYVDVVVVDTDTGIQFEITHYPIEE